MLIVFSKHEMKIFVFFNGYMNDIVPTLLQQSKLYMELEMPTT